MDSHTIARPACGLAGSYLLLFASLYTPGRGVSVPCDQAGKVDIDSLTQRLRHMYFGARAMVGREYSCPTVQLVH